MTVSIRRDAEQIVGRERRERLSQLAWRGGGCFGSRRRVNSTVRHLRLSEIDHGRLSVPNRFSDGLALFIRASHSVRRRFLLRTAN
jgi:hypothetical protein